MINIAAAVFVVLGSQIAFRPHAVLACWARLRHEEAVSHTATPADVIEDEDPMTPVFRMVGVMLMAFSFTAAAFANLIAHYAANSGGA